jgi:geranylgeranyl transferase type-2 subunit alpha
MREMVDIKDLLEDYHDVKWIYEALMEYTLALCAMEERDPDDGERQDLKEWLAKLRSLDPMRNGRWNDLGRANGLI